MFCRSFSEISGEIIVILNYILIDKRKDKTETIDRNRQRISFFVSYRVQSSTIVFSPILFFYSWNNSSYLKR